MAIYKLQPATARVLGSRGGNTFQRCGQQFSIRKRAKPVLKKTEVSQAVRNIFGSIQSHFRTLSIPNEQTFIDATPNFLRVDSIGNDYEIQPVNLFASANLSLVAQGQTQIVSIPLAPSPIFNLPVNSNYDLSLAAWIIAMSPTIVPAGYFFTVWVGETMSDNNSNPNISNLKVIARYNESETTDPNIAAAYLALFPDVNMTVGRYIPVTTRFSELATGQVLSEFNLHSLIVP